MTWGEFFRKNLMNFFIIVTCVSVLMALIGPVFDPERIFGYEAYYSPLLFGVIGVLPSFVTFSRKELTFNQMIVRKVLHLILLEGLILSIGILTGIMKADVLLSIALSIFVIFLLVYFISWIIDSKKAVELNADLKVFQAKE